jgi:hypothetical protein
MNPARGIGVLGHAEGVGRIRRLPASRGVPGNHGELVRQIIELRLPDTTVAHSPVNEHERRPLTRSFKGEQVACDVNPLHLSRLYGG